MLAVSLEFQQSQHTAARGPANVAAQGESAFNQLTMSMSFVLDCENRLPKKKEKLCKVEEKILT